MPSPQERIKATLGRAGIPAKEILCYGSQIMITAYSRAAAERWAGLLAKFSKVHVVRECVDYLKENKGTNLNPSTMRVWRVWSTIGDN